MRKGTILQIRVRVWSFVLGTKAALMELGITIRVWKRNDFSPFLWWRWNFWELHVSANIANKVVRLVGSRVPHKGVHFKLNTLCFENVKQMTDTFPSTAMTPKSARPLSSVLSGVGAGDSCTIHTL